MNSLDYIRGAADPMGRSPDLEASPTDRPYSPIRSDTSSSEVSKLTSCAGRVFEQVGPLTLDRSCTPLSASQRGLGRVCTLDYIHAKHQLNVTGELPRAITPTTALSFMSEVKQKSLRNMAFNRLLSVLQEKKEPIVDYCRAVWLVAQNSTPSFLTKEQCAKLRKIQSPGPFDKDLFNSLHFTQEEIKQLLSVLERRNLNGENGIGAIPCSSLGPLMGNYHWSGLIFRILTDATGHTSPRRATLRVSDEKDIHAFTMYCNTLKNSQLSPKAVRSFPKFVMQIGRIEISSQLQLPSDTKDAIKMLKKENPSLTISSHTPYLPKRAIEEESQRVLLFPAFVDTSSYFSKTARES